MGAASSDAGSGAWPDCTGGAAGAIPHTSQYPSWMCPEHPGRAHSIIESVPCPRSPHEMRLLPGSPRVMPFTVHADTPQSRVYLVLAQHRLEFTLDLGRHQLARRGSLIAAVVLHDVGHVRR